MTDLWTIPQTSVPIAGSPDRIPVRRIYCVGRNYLDHIREMKEGDERDDPFFFQKPTDAIVEDGATVPYPSRTADFQFEGELVVAIGARAFNIPADRANDVIWGYAAGLDLTRRDRQRDCRAMGLSWEAGKAFDHSAPVGPFVPATDIDGLATAALTVRVNGSIAQRTQLQLMIWNVAEIVSHLSADYELHPGDLIFTGTPAGVSSLLPGDVVAVDIDGVPGLTVTIGKGVEDAAN